MRKLVEESTAARAAKRAQNAAARRRPCVDCGRDTSYSRGGLDEDYTVHDAVWAAAGMTPNGGRLCIGCIETRLGRQLDRSDFSTALINDPSHKQQSSRLLDRMQRAATTERK
jgi:hypothetical protein